MWGVLWDLMWGLMWGRAGGCRARAVCTRCMCECVNVCTCVRVNELFFAGFYISACCAALLLGL